MGLANFIQRGLGGIARRDRQDRAKGWVLAAVRVAQAVGLGGESKYVVSETARQRALVKLVQYAFPSWDTPIVVIGRQADSFAAAIRAAGYERCEGLETWRGPAGLDRATGDGCGEPSIAVIADCLEWFSIEEGDRFLRQMGDLAPARIVGSIPTYPECIWEPCEKDVRPWILQRRGWWEERFSRYGFDSDLPPRENLPGISPFLFHRRRGERQLKAARPVHCAPAGVSQTVFVMPETQNAFRWVTEALAAALIGLGHEAEVVPPDSVNLPHHQPAANRIGWAHYWRQYREAAVAAKPGYEVFVTNFEMTPRGALTPWVAELCERPSIKLAVSNFCRDVLIGLGVPGERVHVVPHGYSPQFETLPEPLPLATRKSFRFLAVVNSHDPYRYGTDILLKAYRKAFREKDDVCLVIKDYGANADATRSWFDDEAGPEMIYYSNFLQKTELAAFYAACSAFVAPFRGEGFGMKILDAAVAGLPLIVPLYGGPLDYCVPELVQPVAFERRPVGKCLDTDEIAWREEISWCEPSVDDLATRMRGVFEHHEAAAEKAARLRSAAIEQFSWEAAARKLLAIIE